MAPEPTEVLRAGDRLVVVGRQEDLRAFVHHVVGLTWGTSSSRSAARSSRPACSRGSVGGSGCRRSRSSCSPASSSGPTRPGIALVDDPHALELLAALGLILLLFHLGLEFSLGDLARGRPVAARDRRDLPGVEHRRWARVRVRARLGLARSAGDRGRDRHLVVGDRDEAADRAAPARQPGEPARSSASSSSRTCSSRCTSRCCSRCSAKADGRARRDRAVRDRARRSSSR